jgi:hypothetical protein
VNFCLHHGIKKTERELELTRGYLQYWKKKYLNPSYKTGKHGGWRRGTFHPDEYPVLNEIVSYLAKRKPDTDLKGLADALSIITNRTVHKTVLSKLLKKLGWRWNVPTVFQLKKYTLFNINRYLNYVYSIKKIPWNRIKFVDESHIVTRKINKNRILTV